MSLYYLFHQNRGEEKHLLGHGTTHYLSHVIKEFDNIRWDVHWMVKPPLTEATLELQPAKSGWGKGWLEGRPCYTDKDRGVTKKMLQKLAAYLQAKGHDVSVDEEGEAPILVVIKFKVDDRQVLLKNLRKFRE